MKNTFKFLIYGLQNIYYYFKVIWKTREFDFEYIEDLLLVKYKRMYGVFKKEDRYKALRICITILERRTSDFYFELLTLDEDRYERIRKDVYKIEERDWKLYCKLIEKYHRSWWC